MALDETAPVAPELTFDSFIERVGGWAVLYALYLELGGNPKGLPRAAQLFLARALGAAKAEGLSREERAGEILEKLLDSLDEDEMGAVTGFLGEKSLALIAAGRKLFPTEPKT